MPEQPETYDRGQWCRWLEIELKQAGFPVEMTGDWLNPALVFDGTTLSNNRFLAKQHYSSKGFGAWVHSEQAEFRIGATGEDPVTYKPRQDGSYNIEAIGTRLQAAVQMQQVAERMAAHRKKLKDQTARNREKIPDLIQPRVARCMRPMERWAEPTSEPDVFVITIKRRVAEEDVKSVLEACRSIHLQSVEAKLDKDEGSEE